MTQSTKRYKKYIKTVPDNIIKGEALLIDDGVRNVNLIFRDRKILAGGMVSLLGIVLLRFYAGSRI